MKRLTLTLITTATLTACAPRPEAIAPTSMAGAFDATSCTRARQLLADERQTLQSLSTAQRQAATGDAIGVFLIGVPVSSLTGEDKAGLIATSKGKVLALEARVAGCA
jgi:hypothetical protein